MDQVIDQCLQLGASDFHGQMLRTGSTRDDDGKVHFRLRGGRQFDLGFFRGFLHPLQWSIVRHLTVAEQPALPIPRLVSRVVGDGQIFAN